MNESRPCKSWEGKHEAQTRHMFSRAESCVLHLGNAVRSTLLKRGQKHNDAAKKGVQSCSICVFTSIRKNTQLFHENTQQLFHFFFTVHFWFSTVIFANKKVHPGKHLKILNFCPWIPGIFLCNFQPRLPSWPMDPDPLLHCR